jgi:hypothetical protein
VAGNKFLQIHAKEFLRVARGARLTARKPMGGKLDTLSPANNN